MIANLLKRLLIIFFCFLLLDLNAQVKDQENGTESGKIFFTLNTNMFAGSSYPSLFNGYNAFNTSAPDKYFSVSEFGTAESKPGFGLGAGIQIRSDFFMFAFETGFSTTSLQDGKEIYEEVLFNGSNYSTQTTTNHFNQKSRSFSEIYLNTRGGVFPISGLDLSFFASFGIGWHWQSFNSDAVSFAASRGFDVSTIANANWFDIGDFDGGGKFSRNSFVFMIGLGSEYFISRNISLKFEYQYFWSSYTRDNVREYYSYSYILWKEKSFEYKVGNRLELGVCYFIDLE